MSELNKPTSGWDQDMKTERQNSKTGNKRFWMPKETEKQIIFLSDEPTLIYEHNPKINNNFKNWSTCGRLGASGKCALCDQDEYRYKIAAFTILDCSPWEDKKTGKTVNYTKRLFMAKEATYEKIVRRAKKLEQDGLSLRGAMITVNRGSGTHSPGTGDDFDYEGHAELDKIVAEYGKDYIIEEFDYDKILLPDEGHLKVLCEKLNGGSSPAETPTAQDTKVNYD